MRRARPLVFLGLLILALGCESQKGSSYDSFGTPTIGTARQSQDLSEPELQKPTYSKPKLTKRRSME